MSLPLLLVTITFILITLLIQHGVLQFLWARPKMDKEQVNYYYEMLKKGRLIPIRKSDGSLAGIITFYIGTANADKYVRENMWEVLEDEPQGWICYVDQLLSNDKTHRFENSFVVWNNFKNYIKQNFPNVLWLRWNRVKNNRVKTYIERIKQEV